MVTMKQMCTPVAQSKSRNGSKHPVKGKHQTIKQAARERERNKVTAKSQTINKTAIVSPYLRIIIMNIKQIFQSKKAKE
jgi:hypothetical protein